MPKAKKPKKAKAIKKKASSKPKPKKTVKKVVAKSKPKKTPEKSKPASAVKRAPLPLATKVPQGSPGEKFLGEVEDYFGKISVIALTLKEPLATGDTIHVRGHTTDMLEEVKSLQIEHKAVKNAKKGDGVGIKVSGKARKGDNVYLV